MEDFWLDAMDQYVGSQEYVGALRAYVDDNCHGFVDVKSGEHGLDQNDVYQVWWSPLGSRLPFPAGLPARGRRCAVAPTPLWSPVRRSCAEWPRWRPGTPFICPPSLCVALRSPLPARCAGVAAPFRDT